jgi:hypothetical protein
MLSECIAQNPSQTVGYDKQCSSLVKFKEARSETGSARRPHHGGSLFTFVVFSLAEQLTIAHDCDQIMKGVCH